MGLFETLRKMFAAPDVEPAPAPRSAPAPAAPARPAFDYSDARIPTGAREKIAGILASLDEVETMMDREQVQAVSRTEKGAGVSEPGPGVTAGTMAAAGLTP